MENNGIDLDNCRSQCYDNAALMSGHISSVKTLIIDKIPKSIFTNCYNHSLNLCVVHASHVEPEYSTFFAAVERLWTLFSRSTLRWTTLKKKLICYVKQESDGVQWGA